MDIFSSPSLKFVSLLSWALILLTSCGGGKNTGGAAPLINQKPAFIGPTSFVVDENVTLSIGLQATDPESEKLTFELDRTGDGAWFSVDPETGEISGTYNIGYFDFEDPQDNDNDNVYKIIINVSDGVNSVNQTIEVSILDVSDPLVCSSGETISITENTVGQFYSFEVTKPQGEMQLLEFLSILSITRNGGSPVVDDFGYFLDQAVSNERGSITISWSLFAPINAERHGNLDNIYTMAFDVTLAQETASCSVSVQIIDVVNEVTSGIKFSGSDSNDLQLKISTIDDLDGDGVSELWISSIKRVQENTWEHQAYLTYGNTLDSAISDTQGTEILLESLNASNSLKMFGWYPSIGLMNGREDFTGYELIASSIGDIDNDGIGDVLVSLKSGSNSSNNAYLDRPLAYIMWGAALLAEADGAIDLNTLDPSQGMTIGGIEGLNRAANIAVSGDFDGDKIPDIAIGVSQGQIVASDTSAYKGQVFIVFGSYMRVAKPTGFIDLLDDIKTTNTEQVLILTAEDDHNVDGLPVLSFAGAKMSVLADLDGDGGDELVVNGASNEQWKRNVGVISSQAISSAKTSFQLLLSTDIPLEQLDIVEYRGIELGMQANQGDVDSDGKSDLIFSSYNYWPEAPGAALIYGSRLLSNTPGQKIDIDAPDPGMVLLNATSQIIVTSASFFGDLDGDGRDDLIVSYEPYSGSNIENATISIILAKSLDSVSEDRVLLIDQLAAGDGLHIVNAAIDGKQVSFSVLNDFDGDGLLDLSVTSTYTSTESYIIPGKDLLKALKSGSLIFDLGSRFRGDGQ